MLIMSATVDQRWAADWSWFLGWTPYFSRLVMSAQAHADREVQSRRDSQLILTQRVSKHDPGNHLLSNCSFAPDSAHNYASAF